MKIIVSKLPPDDWHKYRDIRLTALQQDPLAFCSSYDEEICLSEADWRKTINAMWFANVDGCIVGLIGLLRGENLASRHCGHIISLWVKPEFRGLRIGEKLLQELQSIAPNVGLKKLYLEVVTNQLAAIKLYEKMGFKKIAKLSENLLKAGNYLDEYLMEWLHHKNSEVIP